MKRTQIQFDEATYQALRRRAFEVRRSIAAIVRETVAAGLGVAPPEPRRTRPFRFVGAGRSGPQPGRPVSEHHDEALATAFDEAPPRRRRR